MFWDSNHFVNRHSLFSFKYPIYFWSLIFAVLFSTNFTLAQNPLPTSLDTTAKLHQLALDTSFDQQSKRKFLKYSQEQTHSPKKAATYSALLPGLGQAYNKKYWKIPIVYIGFAGIGYWLGTNINDHKTFKKAFKYRVDDNPNTIDDFVGRFTQDDLRILKNDARRNRDLSYIILLLWYGINIVDATVDAHLFKFDMSDNLSLMIEPKVELYRQNTNFIGLNLALDF